MAASQPSAPKPSGTAGPIRGASALVKTPAAGEAALAKARGSVPPAVPKAPQAPSITTTPGAQRAWAAPQAQAQRRLAAAKNRATGAAPAVDRVRRPNQLAGDRITGGGLNYARLPQSAPPAPVGQDQATLAADYFTRHPGGKDYGNFRTFRQEDGSIGRVFDAETGGRPVHVGGRPVLGYSSLRQPDVVRAQVAEADLPPLPTAAPPLAGATPGSTPTPASVTSNPPAPLPVSAAQLSQPGFAPPPRPSVELPRPSVTSRAPAEAPRPAITSRAPAEAPRPSVASQNPQLAKTPANPAPLPATGPGGADALRLALGLVPGGAPFSPFAGAISSIPNMLPNTDFLQAARVSPPAAPARPAAFSPPAGGAATEDLFGLRDLAQTLGTVSEN